MKSFLPALVVGLSILASCAKDRKCECTLTTTDTRGVTTTSAPEVVTYKKMSASKAKSICQKTTEVDVNESGGTSTSVNDCKLK